MIRNLFIINHGIPLVKLNFGECHSLGVNDTLVAGFIEAMNSFSNEITGSSIKNINFRDYIFHFYKDEEIFNNLFVFIADSEEDADLINFKIKKIASIFNEKYNDILQNFNGDVGKFDNFKNILIEMNLTQKNCGGRPECEGCPNSGKNLGIIKDFEKNKIGFLNRFKKLFRKI